MRANREKKKQYNKKELNRIATALINTHNWQLMRRERSHHILIFRFCVVFKYKLIARNKRITQPEWKKFRVSVATLWWKTKRH